MDKSDNTTPHRDGAPRVLAIILACYLVLGTLYATQTPLWQTPDEPAHFNYIQYLAEENRLPVLEPGDYPHEYLEEIKAARFPANMSIAPLRYESHQPPLYYVVAAALFRATGGLALDLRQLLLRWFSVVLGAATLWVTYHLVREAFPEPAMVSLAATAFAATVPMHLAMTAAINNDALAELLLALLLLQEVRAIRHGLARPGAVTMGVLLGLILLTKTTMYLVAGGTVLLTAVFSQPAGLSRPALRIKAHHLLVILGLALLLALPFFVRNARVYGELDILGWQRHDSIVAGQLRTVDLIAQTGLTSFAQRLVLTTFRSFWAQFGWMGVLVDERIYLSLALLTALLSAGFGLFLFRLWRKRVGITPTQSRTLWLLAAAATLAALTYLGYNLKFVQHQGRYLFSALVPLALAASLGLQEMLQRRAARVLAVLVLLASMVLLFHGIVAGDVFVWGMLLLLAATVFLVAASWLVPGRLWLPAIILYVAALALDWICLFQFIVPALRL